MIDEAEDAAVPHAKHEVGMGLIWGGGIVALALAMTALRSVGALDQDAVTRIVIGAIGLMIAWYGNRLPKAWAPSAAARRVQRVAGWSLAVSGSIYAAFWVFAPFDLAVAGGCAAIGTGMVLTLAYCWRQRPARS